jgi:hypothetical protein
VYFLILHSSIHWSTYAFVPLLLVASPLFPLHLIHVTCESPAMASCFLTLHGHLVLEQDIVTCHYILWELT